MHDGASGGSTQALSKEHRTHELSRYIDASQVHSIMCILGLLIGFSERKIASLTHDHDVRLLARVFVSRECLLVFKKALQSWPEACLHEIARG